MDIPRNTIKKINTMVIQHDGTFNLATATHADSKKWKNRTWTWSELVDRLEKPLHTAETFKEFLKMTKKDQGKIKDVGGYVGAYLKKGQRTVTSVKSRQLVTLDLDFADMGFWEDFTFDNEFAAVLHGTHKHSEKSPRFRLIIPLSRKVSPEEYIAVSRKLAERVDIDYFDDTSFDTNRLMFWQSTPSDQEYYFEMQDGEWLNPDEILAEYDDWKDASSWPVSSRVAERRHSAVSEQQDPRTKTGLIGAFCRSYSITEAIDRFLPEEYLATQHEDRYTYSEGSTHGGAIVYDDTFLYSHHGTDPCSNTLCNAFDMVRLHKFGNLDTKRPDEYVGQVPSFKAMEEYCLEDKLVKKTIAAERSDRQKELLEELMGDDAKHVTEKGKKDKKKPEDTEWLQHLEVKKDGSARPSASNISLIFKHDKVLSKLFAYNEFDARTYLSHEVPWRKFLDSETATLRDVDYAGVRSYLESVYGISNIGKVDDAISLQAEKNAFHPVRDYLNGLEWDGKPRLNKVLSKYFGAKENIYTEEAIRKPLVAAVARVFEPGAKFDLVLTLVGKQGEGKSTFFDILGRGWFSDSFYTVKGKEAFEQLQGKWLIEMAELSAIRGKKAELEATKHFITKREDAFRPAFGRCVETFKRQCVFFGTTNESQFLNDPSGNRRFLPVSTSPKSVEFETPADMFKDIEKEVHQIWAEAKHFYDKGETLYLSAEAEKLAKLEQGKHTESDDRAGLIEEFLEAPKPDNWDKLSEAERQALNLLDDVDGDLMIQRTCVMEIWCDCLGRDKKDLNKMVSRDIRNLLAQMPGWTESGKVGRVGPYGRQRYFVRG